MNNRQKSTFHPLGDFLNPDLALLGKGLKKSSIWQKLDFTNHPYLCKDLNLKIEITNLALYLQFLYLDQRKQML